MRLLPALAAAVAVLLALGATAVAANWFGLRDMLMPQQQLVTPPVTQDPEQDPYYVDVISLAGYMDYPESKAAAEWQAFLQDYEIPEGNIVYAPGTAYNNYQVYDDTMAAELDRIVEKYGLKLHTDMALVTDEQLEAQVGGSFLGENRGGGYIYEDGTFHFDGSLQLADYGKLDHQIMRSVRGGFTEVILNVGDITAWQEWTYTAKDGTAVALGLSPTKGLILAELEDSFVTVNVLAGTEPDPNSVFSSGPIGKEEMEALADSIGFALLSPALPGNMGDVQPVVPLQRIYADEVSAYKYTLDTLLTHRMLPGGEIYEPFDATPDKFAVTDVNGDGERELVVSCSNTYTGGMIAYVLAYNEAEGKLLVEIAEYPGLTFYEGGIIKAAASRNQGLAGDSLWPYTLYWYDRGAEVYVAKAMVDAWDKTFGEQYMDEQFPSYADTSGTGVVYYVMDPGYYEFKDPMDITEYQSWYDSWFGDVEELTVPWQPLTPENIEGIE